MNIENKDTNKIISNIIYFHKTASIRNISSCLHSIKVCFITYITSDQKSHVLGVSNNCKKQLQVKLCLNRMVCESIFVYAKNNSLFLNYKNAALFTIIIYILSLGLQANSYLYVNVNEDCMQSRLAFFFSQRLIY